MLASRARPYRGVQLIEDGQLSPPILADRFDQRHPDTTVRARARREHRFSLTFRTLSVPQMARRLEAAGFHVGAVLGDYLGGPWDARADVWILLATKR